MDIKLSALTPTDVNDDDSSFFTPPSSRAATPHLQETAIADVTGKKETAATQLSVDNSKFSSVPHDNVSVAPAVSVEKIERLRRFTTYAENLVALEKNKKVAIEEAKTKASNRQALGLVRSGTISGIGREIEKQKQKEIVKIEKEAAHAEKLLFFASKQEFFKREQVELNSILNHYAQRHLITGDDFEKQSIYFEQLNEEEHKLLNNGDDLKGRKAEDLSVYCKKILQLEELRMQIIRPLANASINEKSTELEKIESLLKELSSQKNRFLTPQQQKKSSEELEQDQTYFFVAHATSPEAALKAAVNIVHAFEQRIEVLQSSLQRLEKILPSASPHDIEELSNAIKIQQQTLEQLRKAQEAYSQIAVDTSLLSNFLITQKSINSPLEEKKYFGIHELLTLLQTAPENFPNDHCFLGRNGKIELSPALVSSPNQPQKAFRDGINLIRLAIFRDHGAEELQQFDQEFHVYMTASMPLPVDELKKFVEKLGKKNFSLSSVHTLGELMATESQPDDDEQLIKFEPALFLLSSTAINQKAPKISKADERQAALKGVAEAILNYFQDCSAEKKALIAKHFNDQFNAGIKSESLTVKNLRSFLKKEREQLSYQISSSLRTILCSITWHAAITVGVGFVGGNPLFSVPLVASAGMFFGGVADDMTAYWRELRPRSE